jgi:PAS domain S-box-containing protein
MNPMVAIIAPYPELRREAEAVVAELGANVHVLEGNLNEGVAAARLAVQEGAEVIISRGGTAMLIAQSVDIPVVEIEVSPFDIIRCLMKFKDCRGPIGVIGFPNFVYGCESIGKTLEIELERIIIESREEALDKMAAAAQRGIRLLIGGVASIHEAAKFNLKGVLVTSGQEALVRAIQEAVKIAEVRARERERAELFRIVVNSTKEGIMVIDQDERITLMNPAAEKVFGLSSSEALGAKIQEKIPNTLLPRILRGGPGEYAELQTVGDKVIVTQRFTICVNGQILGAVANFRDVTEIQRLEQIVRQKLHTQGLVAKIHLDDLVGSSAELTKLKERIKKFAVVDAAVLIMGESGTGKEFIAQGIHNSSRRPNGPFVAVNCAALPESLLESELFGYEEGSFTGAKKGGKQGLFELAHGGTIFLDEIGEMSVRLQSRLLRILQDRMVLRIGGDRIIPVNVRIVAATNRNLKALIDNGEFREDLYYRLNTLTLFVPPLRRRTGDIPVLSDYFLRKHSHLNPRVRKLDSEAITLLEKYHWPGNVRELEHVIERLIILGEEQVIGPQAVEALLQELDLDEFWGGKESGASHIHNLEQMEFSFISSVLEDENNNMSKAAKRLGISRSTLWRKLQNQSKIEQ